MRFISVLIICAVLSGCLSYRPNQTADRLLRSVRAELPKGWTAQFDRKNTWLEVSRDDAVLSFSTLPNGPAGELPERRTFTFSFQIVAQIDPSEYRRLSTENAKIQKQADMLYDELVKMGIHHKFDSFIARTAKEEVAVARYEALKESLHKLPDFYVDDISLEWVFNSPIDIPDPRIRDECARIQAKVIRLLSRYEPPVVTPP